MPERKAVSKKAVPKKAVPKKAVPKKAVAKKAAAKKAAPKRKAANKKVVPKKAATKRKAEAAPEAASRLEGDFLRALDAGKPRAMVELLAGLTESDRSSLNAVMKRLPDLGAYDKRDGHRDTKAVARLGVQTLSDLKRDWRSPLWLSKDLALATFTARKPDFMDRYVAFLLDRSGRWPYTSWPLIRGLVQRGVCARPDHPAYILGLINGISQVPWSAVRGLDHAQQRDRERRAIHDGLLADRALLEHELWRLFEVEGNREVSLSEHSPWGPVLAKLAADSVLSRDRLLDASLDALSRDFSEHKCRWYIYFHQLLEPTASERRVRRERYVQLVRSQHGTVVQLGLHMVKALVGDGVLAIDDIAPALAVAAGQKAKKTALLALESVAADGVGCAARAEVALAALVHDNRDVQARALDLLDMCAPLSSAQQRALDAADVHPKLRPRLAKLRTIAAPDTDDYASQAHDGAALLQRAEVLPRAIFERYGVGAAVDAVSGQKLPPPMLVFERDHMPCLADAVAPIRDLEELIEIAAVLLEDASDIDELERFMDGLSRLCHERPAEFDKRVGPIRKRAETLDKRIQSPLAMWGGTQGVVVVLVCAWTGTLGDPGGEVSTAGLAGLFAQRTLEIAGRVASGQPAPLLAAPTHRRGFIDARTCVARLATGASFQPHDVVQALLRLAPEGRDEARRELARLNRDDVVVDGVAHALGAPATTRLKRAPHFWVAASRSREPMAVDAAIARNEKLRGTPGGSHPGAATIAIVSRKQGTATYPVVATEFSPPAPKIVAGSLFPTIGFAGQLPTSASDYTWSFGACPDLMTPELVRWSAYVSPRNRTLFNVEGARHMIGLIRWAESDWHYAYFLEPLLHRHEPIDTAAALSIAAGLCCKRPHETTRAVDVAIATLTEGRLDGVRLGGAMATLFSAGISLPARWVAQLQVIAREDDHLRHQCIVAAQHTLRGTLPKGAHAFMDHLLAECIETGGAVDDPPARAFLEAISGTSKAARVAKELLALRTDSSRASAFLQRAAVAALRGRLSSANETLGVCSLVA